MQENILKKSLYDNILLFQGLSCGSLSDSDTAALVDMDLHTQMSPGDSVLGIDNVGLDFTDLDFMMDENSQKILNGDYTYNEIKGLIAWSLHVLLLLTHLNNEAFY